MTCIHTWVDTSQRNKPSWTCSKCKIDYNKREIKEPKSWIDLTDDEFEAVRLKHHDENGYLRNENQEGWAYEKELLAKHKEKNT